MAMRVSYGARSDPEFRRGVVGGAARQIARPPVGSLAEAIDQIKADIRASEEKEEPECTTSEITLGLDAVLELHQPNIGPYSEGGEHDLPASFKRDWTEGIVGDVVTTKQYPTATVDAITNIADKHARAVVQRAASRGIVAAIEVGDGFKYSINNAWASKDSDGQRFSYICQDSMQNKDRHANGFTRTLKHLKTEAERGPRKPTYDCKGSVSIKCSMVRRTVDIFYRHYAIHSTVAERKTVPRPPRIRTSVGEHDAAGEGGLVGRLQTEKSAFSAPPVPRAGSQGGSNIGKPLKRKRDHDTPSKGSKPLSLVDLLRQSEASEKAKTPAKPPSNKASMHPPPMNYDLPSWQKPPPAPPKPAPPPHQARSPSNASQPYRPPYQPQNSQRSQQQYSQQPQPNSTPQQTPTSAYPDPNSANNSSLFQTLKAMPQTPLTLYSGRTRSSCTNCRYGKKKCDETRPVCGNCARAGKYDCAYDGAYGYPATAGQTAQMGGWTAVQSPVQTATPVSAQGFGKQQYQTYQSQQGYQQQYPPSPSQQQYGQQQQYQHAQPPAPPMAQYQQQPSTQAGGQREESPDPWFPKR